VIYDRDARHLKTNIVSAESVSASSGTRGDPPVEESEKSALIIAISRLALYSSITHSNVPDSGTTAVAMDLRSRPLLRSIQDPAIPVPMVELVMEGMAPGSHGY